MNKKKILKISLISVGGLLATVLTLVGGFLIFASATTLKTKAVENMNIRGSVSSNLNKANEYKVLAWNMGYGCLDERQDFYYDGGKNVTGESKAVMKENVSAIKAKIQEINPDFFLIQEMDLNSHRSFNANQLKMFEETFDNSHYVNSFARNFKAGFIPIPLNNPMKNVESGIATFSKYQVSEAKRIQLPVPFSWPMSLFNLKRCLLVSRMNMGDKELVLINLHLEAYDDGEGKAKQLKQLMDLMQEEYDKGNYVIAGGDFNQCFSNVDLTKYPKIVDWVCPIIDVSLYPNFTFKMDDTYPTCRSLDKPYYNSDKSTHQYYMLDGFILSNNISIKSFETINLDFKNSDHNPVVLSFSVI